MFNTIWGSSIPTAHTLFPIKDYKKRTNDKGPPHLRLGSNRVAVVGLIGKSLRGKAEILSEILDTTFIKTLDGRIYDADSQEGQGHCHIEMYHSIDNDVIFLNLVSIHDSLLLMNMIQKLEQDISCADFHLLLEKKEYHHLKAMLFMFHVCHLILVVHEGCVFDFHYLRVFRILQTVKKMMGPAITAFLNSNTYLPEFKHPSPFSPGCCVPALAFVFSLKNLSGNSNGAKKATQFKRLKRTLEKQIAYLLRRTRLLTVDLKGENYSKALFTLDCSSVVHLLSKKPMSHSDPVTTFFMDLCTFDYSEPKNETSNIIDSYSSDLKALQKFIFSHCETIKAEASAKRQEFPMSKRFFQACIALQRLFLYGKRGGRTRADVVEKLKGFLDPEYKFSQSRCIQVLPTAREQYLHKLPPYYNTEVHNQQMEKVFTVFYQNTRGPATENYASRLRDECTKIFNAGRRLCDAVSLTGRPCSHKVHDLPSERVVVKIAKAEDNNEDQRRKGSKEPSDERSVMEHSSGFHSLHACNCGKTRNIRDDPFDLKQANYGFFQMPCCSSLPSLFIPPLSFQDPAQIQPTAYENDRTDSKDKEQENRKTEKKEEEFMEWHVCVLGGSETYKKEVGIMQDGFVNGYNKLVPLDIPHYHTKLSLNSPHFQSPPSPSDPFSSGSVNNNSIVGNSSTNGATNSYKKKKKKHKGKNKNDFNTNNNNAWLNKANNNSSTNNNDNNNNNNNNNSNSNNSNSSNSSSHSIGNINNMSNTQRKDSSTGKVLESVPLVSFVGSSDMQKVLNQAAIANLFPDDFLRSCSLENLGSIEESSIQKSDGSRSRKQKSSFRKRHSACSDNYSRILTGVEYECPLGHRFFAPKEGLGHKKQRKHSRRGSRTEKVEDVLNNKELSLFVTCRGGGGCSEVSNTAQLARIFLCLPDDDSNLLTLNPVVLWKETSKGPPRGEQKKYTFSPGKEIILPNNTFLCLRLPYIYTNQNREILPVNRHNCFLLPKFLYFSKGHKE